jgi:hypothetical protein
VKITLIAFMLIFVVSPVRAIPNDPDNAALLYYQGFLSLAQLNDEARDHIAEVARGEVAPDDKVKQDISKCKGAIDFAEAATQQLYCNWGVWYSQGFDCLLPQMAQARYLTFVLVADARIRASDGDSRGALERCLMTERFARHVGDDTVISYLVSLSVRTLGYKCIQDIIGQACGDEELLKWFRNELVTSENYTLSPVRPLKIEMGIVTDLMQMKNIEKLARILADPDLKALPGSEEKEVRVREIVKAANENILERARKIYSERMNTALFVLSTDMSYDSAEAQLKQLSDNFDPNDPAQAAAGSFMPAFAKIYSQETMRRTTFNALVTALDIYLDRIKTGKLPDELPKNTPKDLFSGKDFEYEKTKSGFVLRCPGRDSDIYQFEFEVKK